ncbi:DUF418 domain-containing protein [Ahrensia sp. R2A130]|uniref:DUF418 domain-containing protein n=1 Tax=Ahrensia sp. R2A130 TaxID=744979 RepID=UPI0001E0E843|nr:DUF418 domain-containing protein [Ahrensia sp. R2A130]EFL90927.1 putative membrane protein [Ahrensia sp. R2A130]
MFKTVRLRRTDGRHEVMDVGRGVAVLGILWFNIYLFALPFEAMVIPMIWGEHNTLNQLVWDFTAGGIAGVMRGMFSILFGASAMLLLSRAERVADQVADIDRYFRRLLWLIVFGAVHAYLLIWPHDILYAYGLLGMLIFPFRHVSSRKLIAIAVIMIIGSSIFTSQNVEELGEARGQMEDTLSDEDRKRLRREEPLVDGLDDFSLFDLPNGALESLVHLASATNETAEASQQQFDEEYNEFIERLTAEVTTRQMGYIGNFLAMAPESFQQQTTEMMTNHLLDIGAFLLIGMVLFRSGFFIGQWSEVSYVKLALVGYAVGVTLGVLTRLDVPDSALHKPLADFVTQYGFDLRRISLALANFALVAIIVTRGWLRMIRHSLAACGRMALSLYIAQTVTCNLLFMGFGLALFGEVEHYQLAIASLALTIVQMVLAPLLLARFEQGPLESLLKRLLNWGAPANFDTMRDVDMAVPDARQSAKSSLHTITHKNRS